MRGGGRRPVPSGRWLAVFVLAVVTVLVVILYWSPVLGVRSVQVQGNRTLEPAEVLGAAQVELGRSMLRIDEGEIRSRLEAVPKLSEVNVRLSWPSTVQLEVTERDAAAFAVAADGVQLVDSGGIPFDTVAQPPPGLPQLRVRTVAPDDPATSAATSALTALPPGLRGQVLEVRAAESGDVRLLLTGNREVHWGNGTGAERKAAILPPLLTRPGKLYDVTSPALPTVA